MSYLMVQGSNGGPWMDTTDRFPAPHQYPDTPEGLREAKDACHMWLVKQLEFEPRAVGRIVRRTEVVVYPECD